MFSEKNVQRTVLCERFVKNCSVRRTRSEPMCENVSVKTVLTAVQLCEALVQLSEVVLQCSCTVVQLCE